MDLKRMGRISGFVAAVAMLAMVLQGCGGDGNGSGISQDMYDALQADYDQAVVDRDAAMTAQMTADEAAAAAMAAQMTAEAAQAAAEAAQMTAEAAQMTAENERDAAAAARDAAVVAQGVAETARMAAEAAKMMADEAAATAMTAQTVAEEALETVEAQRDMYQQGQMDAEADRDMYQQAKMDADTKLAAAEAARKTADDARIAAETAKAIADQARMDAEAAKMTADEAAATAMTAQMDAETERDKAEAAKMTADEAAATAMTAQMDAETERDDAMAAQKKAEDERDAAKKAQMDAEAAQKKAEDERDDAMAALTTDTEMDAGQRAVIDAYSIRRSADDHIRRGNDVDKDGEIGSDVDTPATFASRTNTVDMYQGSDMVPGDTDDPGNSRTDNMGTMTLTATRSGSTVTFKATADQDGAGTVEPTMELINFDATVGADGKTSGMYMDDLAGQTKHIFLMSDIEDTSSKVFGENVPAGLSSTDAAVTTDDVGAGFAAADQETRYALIDTGDDGTVTVRGDTVEITADAAAILADGINVDMDDAIEITLGGLAPTDAVPIQRALADAKFSGSYAGVDGTYVCRGGCSFTRNADGELVIGALTAILFVPEAETLILADGDYLVFGAWLKKPDSVSGTGVAAAIAAGNDLFDAESGDVDENGIDDLRGKATYKGDAAGFYAMRARDAEGATSGTFTATAELTASFDDDPAPDVDNTGNISGSIKYFMSEDGESLGDWTIDLDMIDLDRAASGEREATETLPDLDAGDMAILSVMPGGFIEGGTSGNADGMSWGGEWGVQFTGNTAGAPLAHPTGVVGTFGATGGTPAMAATGDTGFAGVIGGFGARKSAE